MTPAAFRAAAARAIHTQDRALFDNAFQALVAPDYATMTSHHLAERRNYLHEQLAECNEQIQRQQDLRHGRELSGYQAEDAREAVAMARKFDTTLLRQYFQQGLRRPVEPTDSASLEPSDPEQ